MALILSIVRVIIFLTFVWLITLIITANPEPVTITFSPLPYELQMPLFLVILACFFLGIITGGVVVYSNGFKRRFLLKRETKKYKKKLEALEHEVEALRLEKKLQIQSSEQAINPLPFTGSL